MPKHTVANAHSVMTPKIIAIPMANSLSYLSMFFPNFMFSVKVRRESHNSIVWLIQKPS